MEDATTLVSEAPKKKERGPCGVPRASRGKNIKPSVLLKRQHRAVGGTLKAFARSGDFAAWFVNKKKG